MPFWPTVVPLSDQYTSMGNGWLDASHAHFEIGGHTVFVDNGSFQVDNAIGQRSIARFNIEDDGTLAPVNGELVTVWSAGGQNLVTPNQSNVENGTTGLVGFGTGPTLTSDNTQVWPGDGGTHSLKVVTDGTHISGFGIQLAPSLFVPGATYTVSCWVYCTAQTQFHMALRQYTAQIDLGVFDFVLQPGVWTRVSASGKVPIPQTVNNLGMYVEATGSGVQTFWADGMQIEQDNVPSNWHVGGTYGGTLLFAGALQNAKRNRLGYSTSYPIAIAVADWHWLADKRIGATSYAYQTCGAMVRNLVDTVLAAEGVTYQRGVNMLSPQQSDVESTDMTQFLAGGGVTITQDTTPANVHHGVGSLKCVTDGLSTFQQIEVKVTNNGSNFPYGGSVVCSWWMKASAGTPVVRCFVQSSGGAISPVINVTLTTSWQKIVVCGEIPFPSSATYYAIRWDTGGSAQALTVWMDQMQMELASATAWSPGGITGGKNLLSANQADVEASGSTAGFTTNGGGTITLTQDTTVSAWSGSGSLKVVVDGTFAFQGVSISVPGALPANGILTVSFWAISATAMTLYSPITSVGQSNFFPALTPQWARYQFTVQLPASPPNPVIWQILTPTTQAGTFWIDGLQFEVGAAPTNWELGGLTATIQEGPQLTNYNVPYVPVSKAFDDLAQYAGFYWQIDQNKMLWFQLPTTLAAPWTYTGVQAVMGTQSVETASPLYRNSQWLTAIPDVTALQTETRKGDGTNRAFTLSYPVNNLPTITKNGTAQSVGIKGVDDVNHSKHWYWSKGDPVIAQEVNDAVLISTDTFGATYIGQWISNVYSQDSSAVAVQAAIDGSSGIIEEAHNDPTITTSTQAFTLAAALLARYKVQGTSLVFDTRASGLVQGQLLTVALISPGWNMPNGSALIESVSIRIVGPWFVFTVKAIVGPFNQNWVQFYQRLAAAGSSTLVAVGSNQNIGLSVPMTATWPTWSATLTATVFACPIVASTLHCGPTVKVC